MKLEFVAADCLHKGTVIELVWLAPLMSIAHGVRKYNKGY